MSSAESRDDVIRLMEVILTAEVFNRTPRLDLDDLTPRHRSLFLAGPEASEVKRPVLVTDGFLKRVGGQSDEAVKNLLKNPFVEFDTLNLQYHVTDLQAAAEWFGKAAGQGHPEAIYNLGVMHHTGLGVPKDVGRALRLYMSSAELGNACAIHALAEKNPALAHFIGGYDSLGIDYTSVRARNPRFADSRTALDQRVAQILSRDEALKEAMDLVIISAPAEIEQQMDGLVCTEGQTGMIARIRTAIENRDFLREHNISEVGKLLFVGPPGTGKTSLALALANDLGMPLLEVRLSMVTSQYLGETSKNIDRIFDLAKNLSPCVLFIDEFDFVAKSRVSDDHGAMKRAVNMLLKNIDKISLIKNGVLLIGATNHPQLLDEAAWRRFDEVVEFVLPDEAMRETILKKFVLSLECTGDLAEAAARSEGFSGADLRMAVKEAVISALMDGRRAVSQADIDGALASVANRSLIRTCSWG
jgi:AAA+ superfamily predicted ATPase